MFAVWSRNERGNKMNIVFWFLVIIILVLLWFCLSFAFRGVGLVGLKLFNDAMDEINKKETKGEDRE